VSNVEKNKTLSLSNQIHYYEHCNIIMRQANRDEYESNATRVVRTTDTCYMV